MLNLSRQQQWLVIVLAGIFLLGGAITIWRQHRYSQPVLIESDLSEPAAEDGLPPERKKEVIIHVAGAVKESGVYSLSEGSRVINALEAAGGGSTDADIDALNLAAVLVDGQRIYVPRQGEVKLVENNNTGEAGGKININQATRTELQTLPGIGPAFADRIITYRQNNGPFQQIEELKNVSGIGAKRFEDIKDLIVAY